MKIYEKPEIKHIAFSAEDIITTSEIVAVVGGTYDAQQYNGGVFSFIWKEAGWVEE